MRIQRLLGRTLLWLLIPYSACAASLSINPAKLDFGAQVVNSDSQAAIVTLSNEADQSIQLGKIIASGIDFVATNDCQTELAPGARCSIQVRFKPLIPGDRMGVLTILASDSANPHFVPLLGKGR